MINRQLIGDAALTAFVSAEPFQRWASDSETVVFVAMMICGILVARHMRTRLFAEARAAI